MTTSPLQYSRKEDWKKTGVAPAGFKIVPPDGKWGWVVLAGCCLGGLTCMVNNIVFGISMRELAYTLKTNLATLSWALSISSGGGCFVAPIVTIIINNYSCRSAAIVGGLLCSIGLVLSAFADSIELMLVTFGLFTGVGKRFVFAPLHVCLSFYFKKYLGIAIGLLTASYAASKFIMTPIIQLILENYGCRGAFLIMGGFMLHVCLGASLLQPVKRHSVLVPVNPDGENVAEVSKNVLESRQPPDASNNISINNNHQCNSKSNMTGLPTDESCKQLLDDPESDIATLRKCKGAGRRLSEMSVNLASSYDIFTPFTQETEKNSKVTTRNKGCLSFCKHLICESIDYSLLKERLFYLICITQALGIATNIYVTIFVFHFGTEVGLSPMEAAGLESARSLGELTGRLAGPILLTILKLPTRLTYLSCVFVTAICLVALTYVETLTSLYSVGAISGFFLGSAVGLQGLLTVEQMGVKRLASVIGLCSLLQGFFLVLVGPFIGWIRDTTGKYNYCLLFLALLQFLIAIIWLLKPCLIKTVNDSSNNTNIKTIQKS